MDDQLVVRIIPARETGYRSMVTPHHGDQLLPREAQHACILVDNLFLSVKQPLGTVFPAEESRPYQLIQWWRDVLLIARHDPDARSLVAEVD